MNKRIGEILDQNRFSPHAHQAIEKRRVERNNPQVCHLRQAIANVGFVPRVKYGFALPLQEL
jgi:hypothetical protein